MRIVLDAMGTDARPAPDVEGAVLAAREYGETIILIGNEQAIQVELNKFDTSNLKIEVHHAEEQILMNEKPSLVMKSKPLSSIHLGMKLVKEGQGDAFVTMGNTGAAHAIATLSTLRRIPAVKRPALTAIYPIWGQETILLDVGANADSKIEWMEQFAVMGSIYAEKALARENPRVATLSNGEEEGKGNQLVREVQSRLRESNLNYIGHIEPKEMLRGTADVVVMDGYVGNIFIKSVEAAFSYLIDMLRQEIRNDIVSTMGGALARPAFRRTRDRMDPRGVGGAPLLGVNGVVIIGHGSSDAFAVKSAIKQAIRAVEGNVVAEIKQGLEKIVTETNA
ncbi:MAG: phosphate acyltransferase PlsX [Anaerolineae bacterium]|nr:phosphate acyltransferase PlsX [Anaerolineae bacterium]MDQ7034234.1 phosphate acyltransferase PlsX [Anaerolineae bacterium]